MGKETYQSPVIIANGNKNKDGDNEVAGLVVVLVAAAVSVAVGASVVGVYSAAIYAYIGLTSPNCGD